MNFKSFDKQNLVSSFKCPSNGNRDDVRLSNQLASVNFGHEESSISNLSDDEKIRQAQYFFHHGVASQKCGKYYEAFVAFRKVKQLTKPKENMSVNQNNLINQDEALDLVKEGANSNLVEKLCSLNVNQDGNTYFTQTKDGKLFNITNLPFEILVIILKMVITDVLDFDSLECFAAVCKGFFLVSRDQSVWKFIIKHIWDSNFVEALTKMETRVDWYNLFLTKPRPNFNGIYICHITGVKCGEESDIDYNLGHPVSYYRYVRFFPNKRIILLVTTEDVNKSLAKLKSPYPKTADVITGEYVVKGTLIIAILRSIISDRTYFSLNTNELIEGPIEQEYQLQLAIRNTKTQRNGELCWVYYSLHTRALNERERHVTYNIQQKLFKPFKFVNFGDLPQTTRSKLF